MQEFCQFAQLRKKFPTMALAISSFGKIQGKLSKGDVQRAADKVGHSRFLELIINSITCMFLASMRAESVTIAI